MAAAARESTVVFVNADVVTMDERQPFAQAVAVRSGRVLAVGDIKRVLDAAGNGARLVDLGGNTLVPGFVDGHGHFTLVAGELDWVDLAPSPGGNTSSIEQLVGALRERLGRLAAQHKYVLGVGYDDSMLAERRHPTKEDLDRVSTELPVWAVHASRHMAVGNGVALDQAGIAASTPDPDGGTIVRRAGAREPTGLLQDAAWTHVRRTLLPGIPDHLQSDVLRRTGAHYARLGITTAQDGATDVGGMKMLHCAADDGALPIDVVAYPLCHLVDRLGADAEPYLRGYECGVRIGGVKIVLDGSLQAKTAWLTQAYAVPPPGAPASYRGVACFSDDEVYRIVADCFARGVQVLAHANGDAAIDQMLEAVERAQAQHDRPGQGQERTASDRRTVMVHAQTAREDQLDRMRALGVMPSFFSTQCFYWGDWQVASVLGRERAYRLDPARSAVQRGIRFTLHNDSPVAPPNMLFLIWNAVTRQSRSGQVIGPEQRLTPAEALRAVTIDAAYQHFEDRNKGSIEVGKLADMAVLSANPLRVAADAIRDITVLATLKEGMPIYVLERAPVTDALTAGVNGVVF
jgi:predicted amidohydrolase YtcJ